MHTEGQIRKAIKVLLETHGSLNTSEIKSKLCDVLEFDEEDLSQSSTRNEVLITQRIGNIVSHQKEKMKYYDEGYIVDKNYTPARFFTIKGIKEAKAPLNDVEINEKRKKSRQFIARKVNWEEKTERDSTLGSMGEQFVCEYEKERVEEFDPTSVSQVIHLSLMQGDGAGYDILSINEDGTSRYIEVKTTEKGCDTPFYMSENEKIFFDINRNNNAYIYRVYNFNKKDRCGDVKIISADELFNDYKFDPITYKVYK